MTSYPALILNPQADRRVKKGHLWIYSNEVNTGKTPLKSFAPGDLAEVFAAGGQSLGLAFINPNALICGRLLTRDSRQAPNTKFLQHRITQALRLREKGGPGTHNGMKSIVNLLGSQNFRRLRMGIGNVPQGWDAAKYVLGRFTKEEQEKLPDFQNRAADAIELILREGFTTAMNRYNGGDKPPRPKKPRPEQLDKASEATAQAHEAPAQPSNENSQPVAEA